MHRGREQIEDLLRRRLAAPQRIRELIEDLDSDTFARRESASRELEAMGDEAEEVLRREFARRKPSEVRNRIENILAKFDKTR
jgi:phosphate uptake regulator